MQRIKLEELARRIANECDIESETLIQGAITLAVAAKKTFDDAWTSPDFPNGDKPPRSKVAGMSMSHVHQVIGVTRLRGSQLAFVSGLLVEAYHIEILPHPLEEAYLFLYLDKLRYTREVRSVWAWKGPAHACDIGNTQDVPDLCPLPEYSTGDNS